jgi:hypothetical protein
MKRARASLPFLRLVLILGISQVLHIKCSAFARNVFSFQ